ncbi:hypothetical protein AVEN_71064-1 [Araneus ventricosus]|uniref:Uncharacterized protein n=1 Tax=Araneus ventricosus TaxID=182803 RepID=A0A4Y2V6Z8_ARAVE|nr:hypothetical protein AVEN_71064-1 [Araneus ventricosus]
MDSTNVGRYLGGNSHHSSFRTVHKSIGVRAGGDLFSTACSKASRISSIMFISGDLGGLWKCLKSEECSWSHLVATLDAWGGVALSQSVGMHNGHE